MWTLMIAVIVVLNGQVREEQMTAPAPFASAAECMARGVQAAAAFSEIEGVRGVAFVCAELPAA